MKGGRKEGRVEKRTEWKKAGGRKEEKKEGQKRRWPGGRRKKAGGRKEGICEVKEGKKVERKEG
jgi:hypothetical protein